MKLYRSISLNKNVCPPDFYAEMCQLYPGGALQLMFRLEAKAGEEENAQAVEHIAALCEQRGLDKIRGAYSYSLMPQYEKADMQAAPLLRLVGQRKMFKGIPPNQRRDGAGRIVLPATEAKATIKLASIFPTSWVVVSNATRRFLEGADLIGIKFEEVAIKGHSVHAACEPFWELRSTLALPKMANSVIYPEPAYGHTAYTIQDPYLEPHYRKSELEPLHLFDIAHTFERSHDGSQGLIVSQRFYQHCLKHKIPVEVRPVRIDSDCGSP
jgi:hypothetical protein